MTADSIPTIHDVARLAEVSSMTVSRILAGGKNVSKNKQKRVHDAIAQLGYHRNENARSIRPGQSTGLIGVVVTNFGNPYYGNLALGVEEVAAKRGKRILLANTGENLQRERQVIRDFIGRQVDGMIIVPSSAATGTYLAEQGERTPVVFASRAESAIPFDAVVLDDVGGAYRATMALIDGGHTRIAFLGNQTSVWTGHRRFDGFMNALKDSGFEIDERLIRRGQQSAGEVHDVVRDMMRLPDAPTAIFSANNRNTVGALEALASLALPIHKLPAMAAFDEIELQELLPVRLTVVAHDPAQLGARAADLLFKRLSKEGPPEPEYIELPVDVHRVETTWESAASADPLLQQ